MFIRLWNWIKSLFQHQSLPIPAPAPAPAPAPIQPAPAPDPAPTPPRHPDQPNIKVCAGPVVLEGIDVSNYQPAIQWNLVADSCKFAFVKATEGITITDSYFATNWRVGRAFLAMSAYHFFRARDTGEEQAMHFLNVMGKLNVTDLPPMLDWETLDGQSVDLNIMRGQTWLNAVEKATGRIPIIYTNVDTWNQLGNPVQFNRYPLYVANIDTLCPSIPPPWSNWVFWQYSWTADVKGVVTACDADRFNGTPAQLQDFIRTGRLPF